MASNGGFRKIVVAYDGSNDSTKAVQVACLMALKFGSSVTVVHVYHSPSNVYAPGPGMPIPDFTDIESAAEEGGRAILARGLEAASKAGVKAKGELMESPSAVEAIVTFASQEGADLLVVGTRGMTGFKRMLVGSVSSGIVSHSSCPVLVVR
ncbi:MAG: universal stress protein [Nitrososphaerota archaeon]|nr:universal stress protein [Nitrososphaerota archaeon]